MTAPIECFDHAMLAVRDLELAASKYRSLGFRLTPKGVHQGKGTANYCLMFADAYIELLGIEDQALASPRLRQWLDERGEGVIALAYGANDADRSYRDLLTAGFKTDAPADLSRPLELDGQTHLVRFRNVSFHESGFEPLIQFVCTHLTPDLTRAHHEWQLHANGVTGLNEVIMLVENPKSHVEMLKRILGPKAVRERQGEITALVEPITLRLSKWENFSARFPESKMPPPTQLPHVAALCLDVNEPDAATAMWDKAKIPFHRGKGGAVYVDASDAHGVILELSEG
jgi:catechol 2,3-dioxygenase-like lactoylglutathione lyase family enzyme